MTTTYYFRDGRECSQTVHGEQPNKGRALTNVWHNCSRCGGTGMYRWWARGGMCAGRCFDCDGTKGHTKETPVYTATKLAKLEAAQARRDARRAEEAAAAQARRDEAKAERAAAFDAQFPQVRQSIAQAVEEELGGSFLESLAQQLADRGELSEAQVTAATNAMARDRTDRAAPHVGTVGERREFDLEVVWIGAFNGMYGTSYVHVLRETQTGATVVYRGTKCLTGHTCTLEEARGRRVSFVATVAEHGEREGKPQTVVKRPAKVELAKVQEEAVA